ncbi:hypothetical protein SAMN04487912_10933 [Arthrobacter sp. cf158]|uniref:hypothetical protein n=1 Tax=Arthrobacter sp. cf158 TaxID=1761744 RepID=UPI0008950E3C|nr:hypothetical protein [Arthrobacter sp. cf158]SDX24048.1 hypothetical protein SAMN04487912_10933 [Arthrobacter sp. cf158]
MTEPMDVGAAAPASASAASADLGILAEQLLGVVQSVEGVSSVYPAQPLWQSIAGAVLSVVTGDTPALITLTDEAGVLAVKTRIAVGTSRPAPAVAREVAEAVRRHLLPRPAAVDVSVVKVGV